MIAPVWELGECDRRLATCAKNYCEAVIRGDLEAAHRAVDLIDLLLDTRLRIPSRGAPA